MRPCVERCCAFFSTRVDDVLWDTYLFLILYDECVYASGDEERREVILEGAVTSYLSIGRVFDVLEDDTGSECSTHLTRSRKRIDSVQTRMSSSCAVI